MDKHLFFSFDVMFPLRSNSFWQDNYVASAEKFQKVLFINQGLVWIEIQSRVGFRAEKY
jgi:hypothetical protein